MNAVFKALFFPFRTPIHFAVLFTGVWALAYLAIDKVTEEWVLVYVAFLATSCLFYALVTVVLPNEENIPDEDTNDLPGAKTDWVSWLYGCAPVWIILLLVMGFLQFPLEIFLFVLYAVPAGFLVTGYRWARMAINLKETDRWVYGQDPKEWQEARKRMGVD